MKKILFLLFICSFSLSIKASHIVGGEFQLYWKSGYNYALEMNFYYDDINAAPGLLDEDLTIEVAIYEKVTNRLMQLVNLKRISDGFIGYQYVECTNYNQTKVRTRLLKYVVANNSESVQLLPTIYNSKNGYYVIWERCCRNTEIVNIAGVDLDNTGQAFYMEFPALSTIPADGGYEFNSEPIFKIITGDFPCVGRPFTFDFSGVDPNGDSLVYTMATPLQGHATGNGNGAGAEPTPPYPAPYPLITWGDIGNTNIQYSATDAIPGTPPLSINPHTGILSVTANTQGLFAFGVVVTEYRNGVKIGLIRRDFQFWVVACPNNPGPAISMLVPGTTPGTTVPYSETDTIKIVMKNKDTCYTTLISDTSTDISYQQHQAIKVTNLTPNTPIGLLQFQSIVNLSPTQTVEPVPVKSFICFTPCFTLNVNKDTLINFTIEVNDQSCPQPKTDTLRFKVLFIPPIIPKPNVTIGSIYINDTIAKNDTMIILQPAHTINFDVTGTVNNDTLLLTGNGVGFSFSTYGMNFNPNPGMGVDSVTSQYNWKVPCSAIGKSPFILQFIATDKNQCGSNRSDTAMLTVNVKDIETLLADIKPYNIITPNGDGRNDSLVLAHSSEQPPPPDNCTYYFKSIAIYNRWGAEVYLNTNRNFAWSPPTQEIPDGVYYYLIDLNEKKLKGWIEVAR